MRTTNYSVKRGEVWERLIVIKDSRTRRKRVPTAAAASIRITGVGAGDYVIPSEISSEGGILLQLTPQNTEWLVAGTYNWDLVATVSRSALLTSTPLTETVVVSGTITVSTYDNITPMASDGDPVALSLVV